MAMSKQELRTSRGWSAVAAQRLHILCGVDDEGLLDGSHAVSALLKSPAGPAQSKAGVRPSAPEDDEKDPTTCAARN